MTTFLVTGAAGFIGSNLCRALLAVGHQVRGLDNFSTGRRQNVEELGALTLFEGDINDVGLLTEACRGVRFILHHAADPRIAFSFTEPRHTHDVNSTGTLAVFEAARYCRSVERVVYASSAAVYGDGPTAVKREDQKPNPTSPYAVSKFNNEIYAYTYSSVFGVPCVGLRYFNVYGPRQNPESDYAAVIPTMINCRLMGERPRIFGDGRQSRDFVFIDDVVAANLAACETNRLGGEVFNVASGVAVDLLTLLADLDQELGTSGEPEFAPARPGDLRHSLADTTAARLGLGFAAQVDLKTGLGRTVAWYRDRLGAI